MAKVAKRVMPSLVVGDIKGVSPLVAPEISVDTYLDLSEVSPNARFALERLNGLVYKLHTGQFSENEINKLRAQLENSVSIS